MCVVHEPDMRSRYYHSELLLDIAYIFGWIGWAGEILRKSS